MRTHAGGQQVVRTDAEGTYVTRCGSSDWLLPIWVGGRIEGHAQMGNSAAVSATAVPYARIRIVEMRAPMDQPEACIDAMCRASTRSNVHLHRENQIPNKEDSMRRFHQLIATLAFSTVATLAASAPGSAAQPEPQPVTLPCATEMRIQVLGSTEPANAAGQALTLVRAFFAPSGGIGPHTHPGTLVVAVESGQFGVTLEDEGMDMAVMRAGDAGTPAAAEPLTAGQEAVLQPGDWFIETGMIHSARTIGDEPVTVVFTGLTEAGQPLTSCA